MFESTFRATYKCQWTWPYNWPSSWKSWIQGLWSVPGSNFKNSQINRHCHEKRRERCLDQWLQQRSTQSMECEYGHTIYSWSLQLRYVHCLLHKQVWTWAQWNLENSSEGNVYQWLHTWPEISNEKAWCSILWEQRSKHSGIYSENLQHKTQGSFTASNICCNRQQCKTQQASSNDSGAKKS